jgi:hypothetical protein
MIKTLLKDTLKLELSEEKTKVTDIFTSSATFLGYRIFQRKQLLNL